MLSCRKERKRERKALKKERKELKKAKKSEKKKTKKKKTKKRTRAEVELDEAEAARDRAEQKELESFRLAVQGPRGLDASQQAGLLHMSSASDRASALGLPKGLLRTARRPRVSHTHKTKKRGCPL